ncbi:hypothetical protein D9M71_15410 [compost metagenome]
MNISRVQGLKILDSLSFAWENNDWTNIDLSKNLTLRSNHKDNVIGVQNVQQAFALDHRPSQKIHISTSNHYVASDGLGLAILSSYVYGHITDLTNVNHYAVFGGTQCITLTYSESKWSVAEILLNINGIEDNSSLLNEWTLPARDKGWHSGNSYPTLVSELDSPWVNIPVNKIEKNDYELNEENYSKYSWAIDQNDFALFKTCYTSDARSEFTALDPLYGLHNIVDTLKEFRRVWPWMQHFGEVLKITIGPNNQTAEMWVGRLIPDHIINEKSEKIYDAHYRVELRKENQVWKFNWSEYTPGWFTENTPPFNKSELSLLVEE